ncbi:MAG: ABC-type transport auxiliary lipoprotein family protein [Novosphingobium sp.]
MTLATMSAKAWLSTAAFLTLAGCVNLGGGKPPPTLVSLTPASSAPAGSNVTGNLRDALVIAEPETDRRLAVQRIPVQIDAANVAYLANAQWVERPARLFRSLLAEAIRAKSGRLVVEDNQIEAGGSGRLAGRLLDMGYDARQQAVVVRYDAIRETKGGGVTTRRFEAVVPGIQPKTEFVGPALNQAANQVAQQVADWVG